jgi:hypothetical protein
MGKTRSLRSKYSILLALSVALWGPILAERNARSDEAFPPLPEHMTRLGPHVKTMSVEMARFYVALGVATGLECARLGSTIPCEDFVESLGMPEAHLGLYLLIVTSEISGNSLQK